MNKQINIRMSVSEVESLVHEVLHTPRGSTKDTQASNKLAKKLTKQLKQQEWGCVHCDCCCELGSVCHCNCHNCGEMYRDCRLNQLDQHFNQSGVWHAEYRKLGLWVLGIVCCLFLFAGFCFVGPRCAVFLCLVFSSFMALQSRLHNPFGHQLNTLFQILVLFL